MRPDIEKNHNIVKDVITISDMKMKDVDDIFEIEKLSFSTPWSENSIIEQLKREDELALYLCAVFEGRVIGYIGMWIIVDEGHIMNLAVHPDYRDMGIGGLLIGTLVKRSEEKGLTALTLEVRKSNSKAIVLYKKFEFRQEGIRKGYYSDNKEDAIIMWKRLKQYGEALD